jgi:hypothetical protein
MGHEKEKKRKKEKRNSWSIDFDQPY